MKRWALDPMTKSNPSEFWLLKQDKKQWKRFAMISHCDGYENALELITKLNELDKCRNQLAYYMEGRA